MQCKCFFVALLAIVLTACSQTSDDIVIDQEPSFKPFVFNAFADSVSLSPETRASGQYLYQVYWATGDEIVAVDEQNNSDYFMLSSGAGTNKGVFEQEGTKQLSGTITCYYPKDLLMDDGSFVWPETQEYSSDLNFVPMISENNNVINPDGTNFGFKTLGGCLLFVVSTPAEGIELSKIEISAASGLSGKFELKGTLCDMINKDSKCVMNFNPSLDISQSKFKFIHFALPTFEEQKVTLNLYSTDGRVGTCSYTKSSKRNIMLRIVRVVDNFALPVTYTYINTEGETQSAIIPVVNGAISPDSFDKKYSDEDNPLPISIVSVNIPEGVTLIDEKTFMSEENLTEVTLPEGLETISASCFAYASALETIDIPSTVKTIGAEAFFDCGKLTRVRFTGNEPPTFGTSVFSSCASGSTLTIVVPEGSVASYRLALRNLGIIGVTIKYEEEVIVDGVATFEPVPDETETND